MLCEGVQSKIFQTLCSGLKQESEKRKCLFEEAATGTAFKFSLAEEREIGTAAVLAHYLRKKGLFTRIDWYFGGGKDILRPDLTVWLPKSKRLLYLELKRAGQGYSYQSLREDMDKLEKVSKYHENNRLNGLIVIRFAKRDMPKERLYMEMQLKKLKDDYKHYDLLGPNVLELADMDRLPTTDNQPTFAAIGLLLRNEQA
ncbi:MAG: hypothetical protein L0177_15540 [Chloroflexi bacterium]|nr:hypothetical protein [Chloroflexota bacterium]